MSQGTTIEQQPQQKQGGDQQGRPQGNRSQLVQRLLDHSVNLPAFIHDLLQTQAVTVAGTEAAAFLLERNEHGGRGGRRAQLSRGARGRRGGPSPKGEPGPRAA